MRSASRSGRLSTERCHDVSAQMVVRRDPEQTQVMVAVVRPQRRNASFSMTLAEYEAILDRNEPLLRHRNPDVRHTAKDRIDLARRLLCRTAQRNQA
jgi:hypothetical protein